MPIPPSVFDERRRNLWSDGDEFEHERVPGRRRQSTTRGTAARRGARTTPLRSMDSLSSPRNRRWRAPTPSSSICAGAAGLPASAALKRQFPLAGVVIVARRSIRALCSKPCARASPSSTEPVVQDDLASRHRARRASRPRDPGQVVAFVGGKGGVGTTTLAVNLATAIRAQRQRRRCWSISTWRTATRRCFSAPSRGSRSSTRSRTSSGSTIRTCARLVAATPSGLDSLASATAPMVRSN